MKYSKDELIDLIDECCEREADNAEVANTIQGGPREVQQTGCA